MFSVKTLLIGIYVINLQCIHNVTNDHILSSFMTYHLITDASCGAGTAFSQFTLYFSEVRGVRSLVFCLIFCISLFFCVLFILAFVLSVLARFTSADSSSGIFKLFSFITQFSLSVRGRIYRLPLKCYPSKISCTFPIPHICQMADRSMFRLRLQ